MTDERLGWAEVVFGNPPAEMLLDRPNLRWLQIVSSGFDEYASLADKPVVVTTGSGVHAPSIAQQVLMSMLIFARGQLQFWEAQNSRTWNRDPSLPFRLAGQTVGFVGYGLVAREIARMAGALGMRSIAVKRTPAPCPPELERLDVCDDSGLEKLLNESDHVVLALPITAESQNLLDAGRVAMVRDGAFFYNVARGGIVDEPALLKRLHDGSLGGAAMDVFAREPLPEDSPWWDAPRTLVFPHVAGHHRDLHLDVFERFADNFARYVEGRPLQNVANFARGY